MGYTSECEYLNKIYEFNLKEKEWKLLKIEGPEPLGIFL